MDKFQIFWPLVISVYGVIMLVTGNPMIFNGTKFSEEGGRKFARVGGVIGIFLGLLVVAFSYTFQKFFSDGSMLVWVIVSLVLAVICCIALVKARKKYLK